MTCFSDIFVCVDALRPSHIFVPNDILSIMVTPVLRCDKVFFSRTQHSDFAGGEYQTSKHLNLQSKALPNDLLHTTSVLIYKNKPLIKLRDFSNYLLGWIYHYGRLRDAFCE